MAYSLVTPRIGAQAIATNSSTQNHPVGTVVCAHDPTYGEGEFIYLRGVAGTTVGALATYDVAGTEAYQTAIATNLALHLPRPWAVAMSACVASEWGWYQISGLAVVSKATSDSFAASAGIGVNSGEAIAAATALTLQGALVAVVASAKSDVSTVQVMISRPHGPSAT